MTVYEVSEHYNIPIEVLREYESWGLCSSVKKVPGAWKYDDTDLERLSMIMTLHDIGFDNCEIEKYMRLLIEGKSTESQRLSILNHKRSTALDEIHLKEAQLSRLDYLRHKIQTGNEEM